MVQSIWLKDLQNKEEEKLKTNIETDVLIIGGGITGISSAYFLQNKNLKVTVVERNRLLHGVTSKTTGKINYLQGIVYSKICSLYNDKVANMYLESQKESANLIKDIIRKEKINCDFEQVESRVETKNKKEALKKEYQFLQKRKVLIEEYKTQEVYGIKVQDTYVFHPLKYLSGIINICKKGNISFFEQTNIVDIKKELDYYVANTEDKLKIKAKKIILACHYPFFLFPYFLPIKTYIEKSYIRANLTKKNEHFTMITTNPNILSERYLSDHEKNYKITLTCSHPIDSSWNEKDNFKQLQKVDSSYIWSNEDVMTYDHLPFIGKIKENLYLATGYNTWGMTNGTLGGLILSDLILDRENKYQSIFDPRRKNFKKKIIQYPINIYANAKSFLWNKIKKKKSWYPKNLEIKREKGKLVAIYKDSKGSHMVTLTCPHMGCTLLFNEVEKTWDCPCHASKFNIDGKCIKGPSKYNIAYKK